MNLNPVTLKKLKRFKSIKRGYYSFVIFSVLVVISLLAELLVNSRALAVSYQGELYFPTYGDVIPGQHFGLDYEYETNYRQLKSQFAKEDKGDWVLLPLVPWNPYEQDFKEEAYPPYAPSLAERHFLGTDTSGRDVLARLVYGFRIAIGFAFIALVASYVIGVSIGCMMGFLGGRFDLLMQRFIELWGSMPELYLLIIFASIFKPSMLLLLVLLSLFGWMGLSDYVRAEFLKGRNMEYVKAAKAMGVGNFTIMHRHLLPNSMTPVITFLPFRMSGAILALTSLDFLGLGVPADTPSLGEMLAQGKENLNAWWISLPTFSLLVITLILLVFIGDGVRHAATPESGGRR